jgi:hypothetical protein
LSITAVLPYVAPKVGRGLSEEVKAVTADGRKEVADGSDGSDGWK